MTILKQLLIAAIALLVIISYSFADQAKVEILAGDHDANDRPTELVVKFTINPGWHIYWSNPGDSGMAPQFQWRLPASVKIGEPRFPIPNRLILKGGLTSFGYEDQLVLILPVQYQINGQVTDKLKVSISYLVCNEFCLSESATKEIDLNNLVYSDAAKLKQWKSQFPVVDEKLKSGVVMSEDQKSGYIFAVLNLGMNEPDLFPPDEEFLKYSRPKTVKTAENTEELRVPFRVLEGIKKQDSVNAEAVLAYTDKEGHRVGLSFRPVFGLKD